MPLSDSVEVMNSESAILGCFISGPSVKWDDDQKSQDIAKEQAAVFRSYIWGDKGISKTLKKLHHLDYGHDMRLILFQFYVNPIEYELQHLKDIESYRKKEKSIGIPIVVNVGNFFSKSEAERQLFLKKSIFEKLRLLESQIQKKRLDTNMVKLMSDLESVYA